MANIINMAGVESGPHVEAYSPNIRSSVLHKQTVELVLMQWNYKTVYLVELTTNATGLSVIDTAIDVLYEHLTPEDDDKFPAIILTNAQGDELTCQDEELDEEDWLKEMVVSARIVAHTPPTVNQVRALNGAGPIEDGERPVPA